jgi:hypothetical protein
VRRSVREFLIPRVIPRRKRARRLGELGDFTAAADVAVQLPYALGIEWARRARAALPAVDRDERHTKNMRE